MNKIANCPICGGDKFAASEILWPELVAQWQISQQESDYINRQQGLCCVNCGNNLRSMALANAILRSFSFIGLFKEFVGAEKARSLNVLEINEAGGLSLLLHDMQNHRLIEHPDFDMTNLPFEANTFDLVIHSDTLEHVNYPVSGLTECCRLLIDGGRCIFTVPVVVDRFTRSRIGLPLSRHGSPSEDGDDLIVHTEFGADVWKHVLLAGFSSVTIYCLEYPAGLAIEGRK